jgi:nitrite reductase/ring-hydroxylating ferredoxin subunit/uncharacterized membrane protein
VQPSIRSMPATIAERYKEPLDRYADVLAKVTDQIPHGRVKDALSGTWLGHPLHPMFTDTAIGAWTSSFVLDFVGGPTAERASTALVGVGVLVAIPTVATGAADWSDTDGEERRIGFLHAAGNMFVTGLYAASWLARRRGRRGLGIALGVVGGTVATATAYVGGHLVFGRGIGVDTTAFDALPDRWTTVIDVADVSLEKPVLAEVGGIPLVVVQTGQGFHVLHDRCTHRGGPLHEGTTDGRTITCPWHGSCFRLVDGGIVTGPATAPQPSLEVRVRDGALQVRRARP